MDGIVKNSSFKFISIIVSLIVGITTSIFVARSLGPVALGYFSFVTWVFSTFVYVVDIGLTSATTKFTSELEGSKQRSMGNTLVIGIFFIQLCFGILTGFLLNYFSAWFSRTLGRPETQPFVAILAFALPLVLASGVLRERLGGLQKYPIISLTSIINVVLTLIGTYVVIQLNLGIIGLVGLIVLMSFLELLLLILFVWRYGDVRKFSPVNRELLQRVVYYCIGVFFITSFDAVIFQRSETLFLAVYSVPEQIAYYGLAFNIATVLVSTVPAALSGVLLPSFSKYFGAGNRIDMQKLYGLSTKYVSIICIPLCFGGIAVADLLIQLAYGVNYLPAAVPLQILLLSSAMGSISGPTASLFVSLGKPYLATLWGIPIAILNLACAFFLVPRYGATGAATANTLCQSLGALAGITYLGKVQGFRLPWSSLLRIGISAGLCAATAYFITQMANGWIGMILAVLIGAVIYVLLLIKTEAIDKLDIALITNLLSSFLSPLDIFIGKLLGLKPSVALGKWKSYKQ